MKTHVDAARACDKAAALIELGRLLERQSNQPGEVSPEQIRQLAEKLDTRLLTEELAAMLRLVWAASSTASGDTERAEVNAAISVAAEFAGFISELNHGAAALPMPGSREEATITRGASPLP